MKITENIVNVKHLPWIDAVVLVEFVIIGVETQSRRQRETDKKIQLQSCTIEWINYV
jgi:hypothetical protein